MPPSSPSHAVAPSRSPRSKSSRTSSRGPGISRSSRRKSVSFSAEPHTVHHLPRAPRCRKDDCDGAHDSHDSDSDADARAELTPPPSSDSSCSSSSSSSSSESDVAAREAGPRYEIARMRRKSALYRQRQRELEGLWDTPPVQPPSRRMAGRAGQEKPSWDGRGGKESRRSFPRTSDDLDSFSDLDESPRTSRFPSPTTTHHHAHLVSVATQTDATDDDTTFDVDSDPETAAARPQGPLASATTALAGLIPSPLRSFLPVRLHVSITQTIAQKLDEVVFSSPVTAPASPVPTPGPITPARPTSPETSWALAHPHVLPTPPDSDAGTVADPSATRPGVLALAAARASGAVVPAALRAQLAEVVRSHQGVVSAVTKPLVMAKRYFELGMAVADYSKSELEYLFNIGLLQARTVLSTVVHHYVEGSPRPSWGFDMHLLLNTLRHNTNFQSQTIHRARRPSALMSLMPARLLGSDVRVTPVRLRVDVAAIVEEERRARRRSAGVGKEGYVVPPEWPSADQRDAAGQARAQDGAGPGTVTADAAGAPAASMVVEMGGEWVETVEGGAGAGSVFGMVKEAVFGTASDAGGRWHEDEKVVLYLHGGAYTMLSPATHRSLTTRIARVTGCRLFVPDYRLAPEHPFPAAVHDAFAAWLYLTMPDHPALGGRRWAKRYRPENVVVMGDSAGGGLAMALMLYLKDFVGEVGGGFGMPGGAVLMSPWVDLTCSHPSYVLNSTLDYLPFQADSDVFKPMYTGDNSPNPVAAYLWGWHGKRGLDRKYCLREEVVWEGLAAANRASAAATSSDDVEEMQSRSWRERPTPGRSMALIPASTAPSGASVVAAAAAFQSGHSLLGKPVVSLGAEYVRTLVQVRHPLVSPLHGDLRGLPPVLIQAGDCELLRDESISLARKYSAANRRRPSLEETDPALHGDKQGHVRHELYTDMVHVFQAFTFTRASQIAIANIGRFHRNLYSRKTAAAEGPTEPIPFEEDEAMLRVNSMGEGGDIMVTFRNVDKEEEEYEYGSDYSSDMESQEGEFGDGFEQEEMDGVESVTSGLPAFFDPRQHLWGHSGFVVQPEVPNPVAMTVDEEPPTSPRPGPTKTKSILKNRVGLLAPTYDETIVAMAVSSESESWLHKAKWVAKVESDGDETAVEGDGVIRPQKCPEPAALPAGDGKADRPSPYERDWTSGGSHAHPLAVWGVW